MIGGTNVQISDHRDGQHRVEDLSSRSFLHAI
jgi:hypothetical protein